MDLSLQTQADDIEEYRMHVSKRYLDLTKHKLELARLPRDNPVDGATKAALEPLLDYWLQGFDFRAQESLLNTALPQFRTHVPLHHHPSTTGVQRLRVHFVHRRSPHPSAVPLLLCHDFGSSFAEPLRVIDLLCEPVSTPTPARPAAEAFHVVCPSVPGFGFGDAMPDAWPTVAGTAGVFVALMRKLGYERYVVFGSGGGFVAREIALQDPLACMGHFTVDPKVPEPRLFQSPQIWLKWRLAVLTRGCLPFFSFGYDDAELDSSRSSLDHNLMAGEIQSWIEFALADSPTGLLAFMVNLLRPGRADTDPTIKSTRNDSVISSLSKPQVWTPSDILTWTMLYWLPGPESPLRWLRSARREMADDAQTWQKYQHAPIGIMSIRQPGMATSSPRGWLSAYGQVVWASKCSVDGRVRYPAWEMPDMVILGLRDFVSHLRDTGRYVT